MLKGINGGFYAKQLAIMIAGSKKRFRFHMPRETTEDNMTISIEQNWMLACTHV